MYEEFVKEFAGDDAAPPSGQRGGRGGGGGGGAFVRGGTQRPGQAALAPSPGGPPGSGAKARSGPYVPSFKPPGMAAALEGGGSGSSGGAAPAPPKPEEPVFKLPGSSARGGKPRAIDALLENLKRCVGDAGWCAGGSAGAWHLLALCHAAADLHAARDEAGRRASSFLPCLLPPSSCSCPLLTPAPLPPCCCAQGAGGAGGAQGGRPAAAARGAAAAARLARQRRPLLHQPVPGEPGARRGRAGLGAVVVAGSRRSC